MAYAPKTTLDSQDVGAEIERLAAYVDTQDDADGLVTVKLAGAQTITGKKTISATSASTDGGTSVEPFLMESVMTGIGGVGGRAKFKLSTEVVLGGWANALKGEVDFGATGAVTGLGSAIVAEMTLGLVMAAGTYAPLEIELNAPTGADLGTAAAMIYASLNGDDAGTFDASGYLMILEGVTEANAELFNAHTLSNVNEVTHGLKVRVAGTDYYLLMAAATAFVD